MEQIYDVAFSSDYNEAINLLKEFCLNNFKLNNIDERWFYSTISEPLLSDIAYELKKNNKLDKSIIEFSKLMLNIKPEKINDLQLKYVEQLEKIVKDQTNF